MHDHRTKLIRTYLVILFAMFAIPAALGAPATAQAQILTIDGATDHTADLGAVNNMGQTIINFCINVVAKVIGVGVAVWGITDFVKRDMMWGAVKLACCGACFFLESVITGLANMSA